MYLTAEEHFARVLGAERIGFLESHNIRHVEQLVALVGDERLGTQALDELQWDDVKELRAVAEEWLKKQPIGQGALVGGLSVTDLSGVPARVPVKPVNGIVSAYSLPESDTGLFKHEKSDYAKLFPGDTPISLTRAASPERWFLYQDTANAPKARSQGSRGTCVAFAVCAAVEDLVARNCTGTHIGEGAMLSPQWAYFIAKQHDDALEDLAGTTLKTMADACSSRGFVAETELSYQERPDEAQSLWFKQSPGLSKLEKEGQKLRLVEYKTLKATDVGTLKAAISLGFCVVLVVPVYQRAWLSPYVISRGEVELPLVKPGTATVLDKRLGFHAITLYGYQDTPEDPEGGEVPRPGGGYFVFRNSWGTDWAKNQRDKPTGYGMLPYRYAEIFAGDAMVYTKVKNDRNQECGAELQVKAT